MGRNRVGDALIERMMADNCFSACVMDGLMNDLFFEVDPPLALHKGMNPHPMNRAAVCASWVARDDRFEIVRFRGHDSAGRARILRLYKLKAEFQ